jgi:hypothetical protein
MLQCSTVLRSDSAAPNSRQLNTALAVSLLAKLWSSRRLTVPCIINCSTFIVGTCMQNAGLQVCVSTLTLLPTIPFIARRGGGQKGQGDEIVRAEPGTCRVIPFLAPDHHPFQSRSSGIPLLAWRVGDGRGTGHAVSAVGLRASSAHHSDVEYIDSPRACLVLVVKV